MKIHQIYQALPTYVSSPSLFIFSLEDSFINLMKKMALLSDATEVCTKIEINFINIYSLYYTLLHMDIT